MIVSTDTAVLKLSHGDAESVRMLKEVGFDAYDYSMFVSPLGFEDPLDLPDYRQYAANLRAYADQVGIVCNQAHAPFPSSTGNSEDDQKIFEKIVRSMETAAILGAKIIIVHPCQHLEYATHAEELKEINLAFYQKLIPYCEQFGIKVATENMFQWDVKEDHALHSTCSQAEEFKEYVDMLDSPWIVGCLDIGHVELVGEDVVHMIHTLGKDRLRALHVHDNDGQYDQHTLPYTRNIDFTAVLKALKEIGYSGDFTFESNSFGGPFPKELYAQCFRFMREVGQHMASQICGE